MSERYRPRPSYGWLSWLALAGVILLSSVPTLLLPAPEPVPVWVDLTMWGIVGLGLYFVFIAALFPMMAYELTETELVASYGPLLTYRVPYGSITDIHTENLTWSLWSSMRLPGLALFSVPYAGRGNIKMCSTRSAKGVLVIETTGGPFGISPAEEERFVAELRAHIRMEGGA